MLTNLTGKKANEWDVAMNSAGENNIPTEASYQSVAKLVHTGGLPAGTLAFASIGLLGLISLVGLRRR